VCNDDGKVAVQGIHMHFSSCAGI